MPQPALIIGRFPSGAQRVLAVAFHLLFPVAAWPLDGRVVLPVMLLAWLLARRCAPLVDHHGRAAVELASWVCALAWLGWWLDPTPWVQLCMPGLGLLIVLICVRRALRAAWGRWLGSRGWTWLS